ncbi:unnamed protein product [Rangifer tarandus platyrhynchus]|uniref:Uncharacterized protein n=1 Tax=Rangifer tarandus platyrhynchus TaxID=3082113 RepID=A0ABN8Z5F6_RANTA|nr:unnamed protein product [Rangifer tarandus platyrhynchus]
MVTRRLPSRLEPSHPAGHPPLRRAPPAPVQGRPLSSPGLRHPPPPTPSSVPDPQGWGAGSPCCSALPLISCPLSACPQTHTPPGPPALPGDPRWDPCQPLPTARDPTGLSLPWPPRRLPSGPSGINTGNRISKEGEAAPEKASAGRAGSEIPILEKQLASWTRDSLPGRGRKDGGGQEGVGGCREMGPAGSWSPPQSGTGVEPGLGYGGGIPREAATPAGRTTVGSTALTAPRWPHPQHPGPVAPPAGTLHLRGARDPLAVAAAALPAGLKPAWLVVAWVPRPNLLPSLRPPRPPGVEALAVGVSRVCTSGRSLRGLGAPPSCPGP